MTYSIDSEWEYTDILTPELLLEVVKEEIIETQKEIHIRYGKIFELFKIAVNQLNKIQKSECGKND